MSTQNTDPPVTQPSTAKPTVNITTGQLVVVIVSILMVILIIFFMFMYGNSFKLSKVRNRR